MEFKKSTNVFRNDQDFKVLNTKKLLREEKRQEIKEAVQGIETSEFEKQEFLNFGRLVMHDLPYIKVLQDEFTAFVSECVGEEVEPCYSFLSLYNNFGVCGVHMDAPEAKWTLDICVDQSSPWPIHFSQIVPWPENFNYKGEDWENYIKSNPKNIFNAYTLEPGDSLLFSGSSQWHYRNRITRTLKSNFC